MLYQKDIVKAVQAKVLESTSGREDRKPLELSQADVAAVVDALKDVIVEAVELHEGVQLTGVVGFHVETRKARTFRNPETGGTIDKPACHRVKVKPGKRLLDAVGLIEI